MESLSNYDSDDENDVAPSTQVNTKDITRCGMEGDNYDDVQMDMSENPLNGSKAPSVQAHSPGWSGGAPPTCATIQLDSNSESASKDEGNCSPHNSNSGSRSSSSSPASAVSSNESESDEEDEKSKPEEPPQSASNTSDILDKDKIEKVSQKIQDQSKRDHDKRQDRDRERDRNREREPDKDKERDRDRRKDFRREERHRSRSRDHREKHRSPDRSERRKSREREELRKSRERRSSSRERIRRRDSDRRQSESRGRDYDRKRQRSRSRSAERHRPGNNSRSSSSSGSSRSDARFREVRASRAGPNRGSRSRSKSTEKDRGRISGGDSRKFYLEKKIDRKMNVLERMGIELKAEAKTSAGTVTPQMLVQRTMEQEAAQVKKATGVELPSYYNAAAVNPQRLVDQIQKRKLLWGAKKEESNQAAAQPQTSNKWQGATFAQDQDGKLTAKFNRLMGIKQASQAAANPSGEATSGSEIIKKQEEMFHNMESQYEVARLATHTHRGLGLGFGTFQPR